MSVSLDTKSETTFHQLLSDKHCGRSGCPAPSAIVVHVMGGEVHICARHAREIYPIKYPAFWKERDGIVFDKENFWDIPRGKTISVEQEFDEEEDEDD